MPELLREVTYEGLYFALYTDSNWGHPYTCCSEKAKNKFKTIVSSFSYLWQAINDPIGSCS